MTRFLASLALCLCLFASAWAQDQDDSQPRSTTLKCRGGKYPKIEFVDDHLEYTFKWASVRADQGLQPGECAWTDRGFRENEPNKLCDFKFAKRPRRTETTKAPYYDALSNAGRTVAFQVENDQRGCLAVTALGER